MPSLITVSLLLASVCVAPAYSKPFFGTNCKHGLPIVPGGFPPSLVPAIPPHFPPMSPTVAAVLVAPAPPSGVSVPAYQTKPIVAVSQPVVQQPQPQYGVPQQQYGVPQPQYGVPQPQYTVPQPEYGVSQPVFSRPVITEVQNVVQRPVIAQVQEVVHRPCLTGYPHPIKLPAYTTPVVQKPDYGVDREPEQYYPSSGPSLAAQIVQPGSAEVLVPPVPQHSENLVQSVPVSVVSVQPVSVAAAPGSVMPPVVPSVLCPPAGSFGGYGKKFG